MVDTLSWEGGILNPVFSNRNCIRLFLTYVYKPIHTICIVMLIVAEIDTKKDMTRICVAGGQWSSNL